MKRDKGTDSSSSPASKAASGAPAGTQGQGPTHRNGGVFPFTSDGASSGVSPGHSQGVGAGGADVTLPFPENVQVSAVDCGTVQVQWGAYPTAHRHHTGHKSHASHATDAAIAGQVKVELGWKLCAQGGPGGGLGGEGVWEAAAVLISGQKVRKKNLQEGHYYKFRVRYVLPGSTATAAAQGKGRA
jgi:hypothetical protein